jgi:hypothetical protein
VEYHKKAEMYYCNILNKELQADEIYFHTNPLKVQTMVREKA